MVRNQSSEVHAVDAVVAHGSSVNGEERRQVVPLLMEFLPEHKGHHSGGRDPGVLAKLSSQVLFPVLSSVPSINPIYFSAAVCYVCTLLQNGSTTVS